MGLEHTNPTIHQPDATKSPSHTVGSEPCKHVIAAILLAHRGLHPTRWAQNGGLVLSIMILTSLSPSHTVGSEHSLPALEHTMLIGRHPTRWAQNKRRCRDGRGNQACRHPTRWAQNPDVIKIYPDFAEVAIPHGGLRTFLVNFTKKEFIDRRHPTRWAQNS